MAVTSSSKSFVGIAFHRRDDSTYDAVYLRPFNFRATDPTRHMHAVQFISVPDYDWPRLRQDSPEEFEDAHDRGMVGLWTGNGSDGDFANLRITLKP